MSLKDLTNRKEQKLTHQSLNDCVLRRIFPGLRLTLQFTQPAVLLSGEQTYTTSQPARALHGQYRPMGALTWKPFYTLIYDLNYALKQL